MKLWGMFPHAAREISNGPAFCAKTGPFDDMLPSIAFQTGKAYCAFMILMTGLATRNASSMQIMISGIR